MMIDPPNVHERKYYEDEFNWEKLRVNKWIQNKIDQIIAIIPSDVETIADIGCGNGVITHSLGEKYTIIGLDRSKTPLMDFMFPKMQGDIVQIPIKNSSVDLAISSEVLEHLPGKNLSLAAEELKRISRKYILITVPNQENLKKNYVKCPRCSRTFNVSMHYNSFNLTRLRKLFPDYRLITNFEAGKPVRQYNDLLLSIRQNIAQVWGRFAEERRVTCPDCGDRFKTLPGKNFLSILCDGLNRFLCKPRPYWLGALFERR